jgi:outer membrane receptor protein involved in Fe transport
VSHQIGASLRPTPDWGLYASLGSGRSAAREIDTQQSLQLQWQAHPAWTISLGADQAQDDVLRTQVTLLEVEAALDALAPWDRSASLTLGWRRGYNGLRDSSVAAGHLVPDQDDWSLRWSQDLDARWGWEWESRYTQYSSDPVALARALLARRVPRVGAAMGLTGFGERSHALGVRWQASDTVQLQVRAQYSLTVIGQAQRALEWGFSLPLGKQGTGGVRLGHARSDAVLRANGTELLAAQSSNSLSFTYSLQWE